MRMKSMRYGYRVQNSDFDFPPESVKAIINSWGSSMISRGYCFPLILR